MMHKETGFIAKRVQGKKTYFAIGTLGWTARMARNELMSGIEHISTWEQKYREGWRIVKVRISEITNA